MLRDSGQQLLIAEAMAVKNDVIPAMIADQAKQLPNAFLFRWKLHDGLAGKRGIQIQIAILDVNVTSKTLSKDKFCLHV